MTPEAEYTERLNQRRQVLGKYTRIERNISYSRGIVFAFGILILWLSSWTHLLSAWWVILPILIFAGLLYAHEQVLQAQALASRSVKYYERGFIRLNDGWPENPSPYDPHLSPKHPYGSDLDLFGEKSLYERLNAGRTEAGRNTLALWLLSPASGGEILQRQTAVEEMRPLVDFREDLAVLGRDISASVGSPMRKWAATPAITVSPIIRLIAPILAAGAVLTLIGLFAWKWNSNWFLLMLAAEYFFARAFRKVTQSSIENLDRAGEELSLLVPILKRIENETFSSPKLKELFGMLQVQNLSASEQIARLQRLIDLMDSMRNAYFAPLGAILLWRSQIAFAIQKWRAQCGTAVEGWLAAVGEIEALASFAAYSFEHPNDPFPEIVEKGPCFDGHGLGHPLIPEKVCVRNDLQLNEDLRLLVVSGSNMSGKSTLLRTVGINTVLALAGCTVRASRLRVSPLAVGASLHIVDSLQSGASHFYAEITRLRLLMDVAAGPLPVLFLLDEILHGTNSADRRIGSEAVVRGYLQRGAIGLITTHDLALAQIAEALAPHAANVHFEDHMENGRIAFDYRVHPGIIQRSNAIALMRAIGLEV